MFSVFPVIGAASQFFVFTIQPYFMRIAILTLLNNGTGTITYYEPRNAAGVGGVQNSDFLVFPNPAAEFSTLIGMDPASVVKLTDIAGTVVFDSESTRNTAISGRMEISAAHLVNGEYFVQLSCNGNTTTENYW